MKAILQLVFQLLLTTSLYGAITWDAPQTISTPLTEASNPQVVIDINNNITAVWVENNFIMASNLPDGGSWSTPTRISGLINTASDPKLAIDASGNVTALWVEDSFVKSATSLLPGVWGVAVFVSLTGASTPALAVDSSGNAVAVWVRGGFVESSTRIAGIWSVSSVRSAANSNHPDVAISDFGTAIAAWHNTSSGADVIVTSTLTVSTNTWATNKNVFTLTAAIHHDYPKVAIDTNGNATVSWFRYNLLNTNAYVNTQLLSATLNAGASAWAVSSMISSIGIINPADLTLKLAYDDHGNTIGAWTQSYDGMIFNVEAAQRAYGLTWPDFVNPQIPTLYSFGIDLKLAGETALLLSMRWNGTSIAIVSRETSAANPQVQGWTLRETISTGNNANPVGALSKNGSTFQAAALWIHFDGVNNVIQAATGAGAAVSPPSNVNVTQNVTDFGVYQDFYNTITWEASSEPTIVQYNIFKNNVFIALVNSDIFEYVDHNNEDGATVTYGVAGVTSDYKQTEIISFTLNP